MIQKCEIRQQQLHWYLYINGKSYGYYIHNLDHPALTLINGYLFNDKYTLIINKDDYKGKNYDVILEFYVEEDEIEKIFNKPIKNIEYHAFKYNCRDHLYNSIKHLLTNKQKELLYNQIKLSYPQIIYLFLIYQFRKYKNIILIIIIFISTYYIYKKHK